MNEINYVHFLNEKLRSPFAPTWDYFIAEKLLSNIQCTRLKNYLLSKQQEVFAIKNNLDDCGTGLGNETTTARSGSYNIFTWDQPDINILKKEIASMCNNYHERVTGKKISKFGLAGWMNIIYFIHQCVNRNLTFHHTFFHTHTHLSQLPVRRHYETHESILLYSLRTL